MSIEQQRNNPDTSAQATGRPRLTAANLDRHNRDTLTMTAGQSVRSWLNDTVTPSGRSVDDETWASIVEGDPLAADIEAIVRGGHQDGAGQR
jgi:hypothetical protein